MKQRLLTFLLGCLLASGAFAASYQTTDGRTLPGEPVGFSNRGLVMKLPDGSYSSATPWAQLSQVTLKELRDHPKAARFVEPFIQLTAEEREKLSGLTLEDVPRLDRPAGKTGIVGMLFSSGVGWFLVLLIYFGNLFSAYEIALYRAYSPQAVCALAAVLPWISQAALLAIPREKLVGAMGGKAAGTQAAAEELPEDQEESAAAVGEPAPATGAAPTVFAPGEVFEEVPLPPETLTPLLPDTVTYSRGVVTFNRRFFESKLARFTKIVPPDDAKDFVLLFKTSRGNHLTNFISKLDPADLHLRVAKGNASEEVKVPYLEIFEVQMKHKDLA
jgi:hypothetical protein